MRKLFAMDLFCLLAGNVAFAPQGGTCGQQSTPGYRQGRRMGIYGYFGPTIMYL